jgi:hypothetical protein
MDQGNARIDRLRILAEAYTFANIVHTLALEFLCIIG